MLKFFKNTYIFLPIIYFVGAALDLGSPFGEIFPTDLPFLALGVYFLWVDKVNYLLLFQWPISAMWYSTCLFFYWLGSPI